MGGGARLRGAHPGNTAGDPAPGTRDGGLRAQDTARRDGGGNLPGLASLHHSAALAVQPRLRRRSASPAVQPGTSQPVAMNPGYIEDLQVTVDLFGH